MKISELKESRYLTKEDCPLRLTIKSVEKENVAMEGEESRDKYVMFFNETEKGMVLNSTNGQIMAENFGSDDSDDWINRRVDLYNDKNVMFAGKRVGGIRVISQPDANKGKADIDRQTAREAQANRELQTASSKRAQGHPDFPSIPEQEAYWARKEKEEQSDVPF